MSRSAIPESTAKDLADATGRALSAMQDPKHADLLQKFKDNPLPVIAQFGGPIGVLDAGAQAELAGSMKKLAIPGQTHLLGAVHWGCIGCEAGLNVVIVAAGGAAAIAVAVLAGPEALVASGVVLAIAGWTGLTASVVAGIIMGVVGGSAVVVLEAVVAAICQATGACA